jgi:hypothetical protein
VRHTPHPFAARDGGGTRGRLCVYRQPPRWLLVGSVARMAPALLQDNNCWEEGN